MPILVQILPKTVTLNYNTGHVDFNFHLNGDRTFDPYIGLSFIGGTCVGGGACNIVGGEGRLGVQMNVNTFFFYLQAQYQSINFLSVNSQSSLINSIGSIGIGVRF